MNLTLSYIHSLHIKWPFGLKIIYMWMSMYRKKKYIYIYIKEKLNNNNNINLIIFFFLKKKKKIHNHQFNYNYQITGVLAFCKHRKQASKSRNDSLPKRNFLYIK